MAISRQNGGCIPLMGMTERSCNCAGPANQMDYLNAIKSAIRENCKLWLLELCFAIVRSRCPQMATLCSVCQVG